MNSVHVYFLLIFFQSFIEKNGYGVLIYDKKNPYMALISKQRNTAFIVLLHRGHNEASNTELVFFHKVRTINLYLPFRVFFFILGDGLYIYIYCLFFRNFIYKWIKTRITVLLFIFFII